MRLGADFALRFGCDPAGLEPRLRELTARLPGQPPAEHQHRQRKREKSVSVQQFASGNGVEPAVMKRMTTGDPLRGKDEAPGWSPLHERLRGVVGTARLESAVAAQER